MNRIAYWLPIAVVMLGCSAEDSGPGENAGSLALSLETNGVTLHRVTVTITGDSYKRATEVDVTTSTRISALVGGIPVGHFELTLSAIDADDPSLVCSGAGAFDIVAGQTASTTVDVYCQRGGTTGSVAINGAVHHCPRIAGVSAEPSEAVLGEVISLVVSTDDPDANYFYEWSARRGDLAVPVSGEHTPNLEITCTTAGPVDVEVSVVDADGVCLDTATAVVTCTRYIPPTDEQDDASTPGDDRAGYIACGYDTCTPGLICCPGEIGCAASSADCIAKGAPDGTDYRACDGPEDCPNDEACAVSRHWVSCGPATFYGILCHQDSDCVSTPDVPNPCQPSGYCYGPVE
jgi:hypothetical protein